MVFNKDYDRTLWLVLYADKNNRYDIANFIRIIPKELIERIRKELNGDINSKIEFSKAIRDSNGVLSKFDIKIDKYSLRIRLSSWDNDIENAYDLDLGKINFDMIDDSDLMYVGSYYFGNTSSFLGIGPTVVNADGFGYEMYVNEKDKLVIQVSGSKFLFDYQYDKVVNTSVDDMDIKMDDLINKSCVNRLIRGKRLR